MNSGSADPGWISSTVRKIQQCELRVVPVYSSGRTQPFAQGQSYNDPQANCFREAVYVAVVLDELILVDWDGYKDDSISIAELAAALNLPSMPNPIQRSGDGTSLHFLFRRPAIAEDLKASNDGYLPGVDIKTGNQLMHIKPTKVLEEIDSSIIASLPVAPRPVIDALVRAQPKRAQSREWDGGEEQVQEARRLLEFVSPDVGYRDWLKVLMAIHQRFGNTPLGVDLADQWSRPSWKYSGRQEIEYKFSTFNDRGGVDFASLKMMALDGGYYGAAQDGLNQLSKGHYECVRGEPASWPDLTQSNYRDELPRRWVFVAESNTFFDLATYSEISKDALNTQYAHIKYLDPKQNLKSINAAAIVAMSERKNVVSSAGWYPTDDDFYFDDSRRLVNTYRGPALARIKGEPTLWLSLMNHIYGDYAQLVIGHMAFTVQRPAEKIRWQVLVVSEHKRTGKSSTAAPLKRIFANEHQVVSAQDLDNGWGDYEFGNKVILVEELRQPGKGKEFFNRIKAGLVNSDSEMMNLKHRSLVRQRNLRSYYLFTNHWDAVTFDQDEDKLLVVEAPASKWPGSFREYHDAMENGDLAGVVYDFLLSYDLSDFPFDALPVQTAALKRLCRESSADYQDWIREQYEAGESPFDWPCIPADKLREELSKHGYSRFGRTGIQETLKGLGYIYVDCRASTSEGRKRVRRWIPSGLQLVATQKELYTLAVTNSHDCPYPELGNTLREWLIAKEYANKTMMNRPEKSTLKIAFSP